MSQRITEEEDALRWQHLQRQLEQQRQQAAQKLQQQSSQWQGGNGEMHQFSGRQVAGNDMMRSMPGFQQHVVAEDTQDGFQFNFPKVRANPPWSSHDSFNSNAGPQANREHGFAHQNVPGTTPHGMFNSPTLAQHGQQQRVSDGMQQQHRLGIGFNDRGRIAPSTAGFMENRHHSDMERLLEQQEMQRQEYMRQRAMQQQQQHLGQHPPGSVSLHPNRNFGNGHQDQRNVPKQHGRVSPPIPPQQQVGARMYNDPRNDNRVDNIHSRHHVAYDTPEHSGQGGAGPIEPNAKQAREPKLKRTTTNDTQSDAASDAQASKQDQKFAQARAARVARFQWNSKGIMTVNPRTAYPESDIEVNWTLPVECVSRSAYDRNARNLGRERRPSRGSAGDNSKVEHDCDWIGLYRARTRVDRNDAPILTRRIMGSCHLDSRKGVVTGRLRLRAPRGVGDYDFRYYKLVEDGDDNDQDVDGEYDAMKQVVLPVTRSNPVRVEVQGYVLAEALAFVSNTLSGNLNARRFSSGAAQLATLIAQLRTLRHPLASGGGRQQGQQQGRGGRGGGNRGGSQGKRGNRSNEPVRTGEQQEEHLMKLMWPIVDKILRSYAKVDSDLEATVQELAPEVADMKEKLRVFHEQHRQKYITDDDNAVIPEPSEPPPVDLAQKKEMERILYQSMRDQTSLGNAVHSVLFEIGRSEVILPLLDDGQVSRLAEFKVLYSPITERFFHSFTELERNMLDTLGMRLFRIDLQQIPPAVHRQVIAMNFPAVGSPPPDPKSKDWYNSISVAVTHKARELIPGKEFFEGRDRVIKRVQHLIQNNTKWGKSARLLPFGSSANHFGGHGADLDMSLIVPTSDAPEACEIIDDIAEFLRASGENNYQDVDDVRKTARIPILQFTDVQESIECDICIGNLLALRNTEMLKTYALIDDRVRIVASIIKKWAKLRNINSPSSHTLSSYGYLLLLIHYFQRCKPHPLVPVLQALPPNWDGVVDGVHADPFERPNCPQQMVAAMDGREHDTYFYGDPLSTAFQSNEAMMKLRAFAKRNTASVGELLAGFFFDQAFAFDFRRFVVSVRTGSMVPKENKAAEDSWKLHSRTAIEDPFETGYDVGHVLRDNSFQMIRQEFARGFAILSGLSVSTDKITESTQLLKCLLTPAESDDTDDALATQMSKVTTTG